jgi:hypothetical protein
VQVDPIKPTLEALGTQRLKLNPDEPLSNLAFTFYLRRYNWASYFAEAPATVEVGNIWHLGKEFVPASAALRVVGETMPAGIDGLPAGAFAVKGVSLYVDRAGKLVLVATDRGATWVGRCRLTVSDSIIVRVGSALAVCNQRALETKM